MTRERLKEIKATERLMPEWWNEAVDELIAAVEQQGLDWWIDVNERLPEKDEELTEDESVRVLLSDVYGNCLAGYYDFYSRSWSQSSSCESVRNVTHWRPLPNPPTK